MVRASTGGGSADFEGEVFPNVASRARLLASLPFPPNYGVHDTFVRDGLLVVCAWNSGLYLYDIGGGGLGGSPEAPALLSRFTPPDGGIPGGPQVHNAWWLRDRTTGSLRYLLVGQEGPRVIGARASGDLRVVDWANRTDPRDIAWFRLAEGGAHNFWVDEERSILYAAFYSGGVIALDVAGDLAGDLSSRLLAQSRPGSPDNTFTWGVQLRDGQLWAIDMLSGLWQLDPTTLEPVAGGFNVREALSTEFWVGPQLIWTGTRGSRAPLASPLAARVLAWNPATLARVDSLSFLTTTVSDIQASDDGRTLFVTTEPGDHAGIHVFAAEPGTPRHRPLARIKVNEGVHTATLAVVNGRSLLFAAKNPPGPALMIYDVTDLTTLTAMDARAN